MLAGWRRPSAGHLLGAHTPPYHPLTLAPLAPAPAGEASFAVFGIFDGHGGRSVATYASNNLLKLVMARVNAAEGAVQVRQGVGG